MAAVDWHSDALDDLVRHDAWRVANKWTPLATEIMDKVAAVFFRGPVHARHQCRLRGEILPVYRTHITVRSKRFQVYFLDVAPRPVIRRVIHPRRDRGQIEVPE